MFSFAIQVYFLFVSRLSQHMVLVLLLIPSPFLRHELDVSLGAGQLPRPGHAQITVIRVLTAAAKLSPLLRALEPLIELSVAHIPAVFAGELVILFAGAAGIPAVQFLVSHRALCGGASALGLLSVFAGRSVGLVVTPATPGTTATTVITPAPFRVGFYADNDGQSGNGEEKEEGSHLQREGDTFRRQKTSLYMYVSIVTVQFVCFPSSSDYRKSRKYS